MIKIIVNGVCGKMGARVVNLIEEQDDLELSGALETETHQCIGKDIGKLMNLKKQDVIIHSNLKEIIKKGEVIIEFTHPEATLAHLKIVSHHKKGMVIGTTGFTKKQLEVLKENVKDIPCVLSPNMSIGVNILFKIVKEVDALLKNEYDVEITEAHHRFKKDAPSGTAKRLAQILAEGREVNLDKIGIYGREGMLGERKKGEIGIHALRAGDIVGEHTVIFGGIGERLELIHRAHSRDTFAQGALRAARFVAKASPGLYDMEDVLKVN